MSLLLFILILTGEQLHSQYIHVVCSGDRSVIYRVEGTEGSTFEWRVEGGTIVSDWGDSISVNWNTEPGEYEIRVQETSRYGCPAIPVSGIVLVSGPEFDLGMDQSICEGEAIELEAPSGYSAYLWNDGSSGRMLTTGSEGYKALTIFDDYGCSLSDSIYLTVNRNPVVELGPDTSLCGTEELMLDAGGDGVIYNWSTGDGNRDLVVYEGEKTIWVEVIDENSCRGYDTIIINACQVEERFAEMPTAFTPNGDGRNDVWRIPELEPFPNAVVEIYDRWGILIYKSEPGYSDPWDGIASDGRTMPMDSYYFVIDLGDGKSEPLVGTVTIIK